MLIVRCDSAVLCDGHSHPLCIGHIIPTTAGGRVVGASVASFPIMSLICPMSPAIAFPSRHLKPDGKGGATLLFFPFLWLKYKRFVSHQKIRGGIKYRTGNKRIVFYFLMFQNAAELINKIWKLRPEKGKIQNFFCWRCWPTFDWAPPRGT